MLDDKESTPVFLQAQADMGTVIITQYITTNAVRARLRCVGKKSNVLTCQQGREGKKNKKRIAQSSLTRQGFYLLGS